MKFATKKYILIIIISIIICIGYFSNLILKRVNRLIPLFSPLIEINNNTINNTIQSGYKFKLQNDQEIIEILKKNKINECNIITISNYGYKDLTLNWIKSLQNNNFNKFVIFCFDIQLINLLIDKGLKDNLVLIPQNWTDFNITSEFSSWASTKYNQITQAKVHVWYRLIKLKQNIFFSDPDVVWLNKNIVEHIEFIFKYSYANIIFTQDQDPNKFYYNTGLFYAKSTLFVENLFKSLIEVQRKDPQNSIDQIVLDKMLKESKFNDSRLLGLDPFLFASGKVFFHDNLNVKMNISPYTVHANYLIGESGKINAFKSKNLWFI